MKNLAPTLILLGAVVVLTGAAAAGYSIPADQLDIKKVFWGEPNSFHKPGEIDYESIIKATPEFHEIHDKRLEKGTGRYWILLSKASDRAVRAISSFGEDSEFDLLAAQGYLESLKPAIPAQNVTKLIIKSMDSTREKDKSKDSKDAK